MKKRNLTTILIASSVMMLSLAGCGVTAGSEPETSVGAESEAKTDETPVEEEFSDEKLTYHKVNNPSAEDASFEFNGNTITFTDDLETVKTALGKPSSEDQASNSDDPSDRTYSYGEYPNVVELTVIGGKMDSIMIYDSSIKTSRGISMGSTAEDVIAAYGDAEVSKLDGSTEIDYDFGNFMMIFFVDKSNKVDAIYYGNK